MLRRSFNGAHGTLTRLRLIKPLIFYSTPANSQHDIATPPTADYLVKFVGFSHDEAVSIATKVSHRSKSFSHPELAVEFLKSTGFDSAQIRKVVRTAPSLLHCKVEETLKPKIAAFQELGLRGSDLVLVLSQQPVVLRRGLKSHIIPTLELLKSLLGSNELLIKLLLKSKLQILLSSNAVKYLPDNVALLQSYGVSSQKLNLLFLQKPLLLLLRPQWLEEKLKAVEEKLGIHRTSTTFLSGVYTLISLSQEKLDLNLQVFYSYGWTETQVMELIRKLPSILMLSERILRHKLKYFMEDLGYGWDYLVTHPSLFTYSLEKRIRPRNDLIQALKKKELLKRDVGFYTVMSKPESRFVKEYVAPFKDKLPKLYEFYMQQTSGGSLSEA